MPPPARDGDAEWRRDRDLVRARQEIEQAKSLLKSAEFKISKDQRTKKKAVVSRRVASERLDYIGSMIAKVLQESPKLYVKQCRVCESCGQEIRDARMQKTRVVPPDEIRDRPKQ